MMQIEKGGYVQVADNPASRAAGMVGHLLKVLGGPFPAVRPTPGHEQEWAVDVSNTENGRLAMRLLGIDGVLVCACQLIPIDMTPAPGFQQFLDTALLKPVDLNGTN